MGIELATQPTSAIAAPLIHPLGDASAESAPLLGTVPRRRRIPIGDAGVP
jgi:hypothetical protein